MGQFYANPNVPGGPGLALGGGTAPTPKPLAVQSPSALIAAQIQSWAVEEFKAAGYDEATSRSLAAQVAQQAASDYDAAISNGSSPIEAAQAAKARSGGSVIGELQKVGVTTLRNPQALSSTGTSSSGATFGSADVTQGDRGNALDQYREGIKQIRGVYDQIAADPTNDPNARDTFREVVAPTVTPERVGPAGIISAPTVDAVGAIQAGQATAAGPINPALVGPADRLKAALAQSTTVGGTTLDTAQSDESRALAMQNLDELQATARGQGAGQIAADARTRADLAKNAMLLNSQARAERGYDRKGALRSAILMSAEQGANALVQREAQNAQERQQAQQAVGQQIQQTRTTDVNVAAEKGKLDQTRKTLQAQLDNARNINDANAINDINKKMADLDRQEQELNAKAQNDAAENFATRSTDVSKFNTGEGNHALESGAQRLQDANKTNAANYIDVDKANVSNALDVNKTNATFGNNSLERGADRSVTVQTGNNAGRLAANEAGSRQDIEYRKLQLDVQKAIEQSAQGLLDESQKAAALKIAQEQLAIARARADREAETYWFDKVSALLIGAGTVAATAVSDVRAKENLSPVKPRDYAELKDAIKNSMAFYDYKDGVEGTTSGRKVSPMAQAIESTKLGRALIETRKDGVKTVDYGRMAAILAAANVDEKKRRAN